MTHEEMLDFARDRNIIALPDWQTASLHRILELASDYRQKNGCNQAEN